LIPPEDKFEESKSGNQTEAFVMPCLFAAAIKLLIEESKIHLTLKLLREASGTEK